MSDAKRYRHEPAFMVICSDGDYVLESKYSDLKAEVAGLKTGYQAYERVNAELKAEVEELRKGWYSDDGDNIRFWPEEMEGLRSENEELLKAIDDINGTMERDYWSEYAGLEDTRDILDAAMRIGGGRS